MAVIANLDIVLGAQTQKVSKGYKEVETMTSKLRGTILGLAGAFTVARVAQEAYNVGLTVFNTLMDKVNEIDAMAEQADLIGDNVNELRAMGLAAKFAGDSEESLQAAVIKTNRVVGEALAGGKAQQEALQKIGLSVSELNRLEPVQRIFEIGEAIAKTGNEAQQAAAGNAIFGKSWADVLRTVRKGPEELERMRQKMDQLGLNLSDKTVEDIQRLKDTLDELDLVIEGLTLQVLPAFVFGMQLAADALIEAATAGEALRAALSFTQFGQLAAWAEAEKARLEAMQKIYDLKLQDQLRERRALRAAEAAAKQAADEEAARIQEISDKAEDARKAEEAFVEKMKNAGESLRLSLRTPLEEFRDELVELQELAKFGAINEETAARAIEAARKRLAGELAAASPSQLVNLTSAQRGTVEALTPFLERRIGGESVPKNILKATEEGNRVLREIENELRRNPPVKLRPVSL